MDSKEALKASNGQALINEMRTINTLTSRFKDPFDRDLYD